MPLLSSSQAEALDTVHFTAKKYSLSIVWEKEMFCSSIIARYSMGGPRLKTQKIAPTPAIFFDYGCKMKN
jgi:hypothetical protein